MFGIPGVFTICVTVFVINVLPIFVISFSISFPPPFLAVWYSRGGHNISINLHTCYTPPVIQCVSPLSKIFPSTIFVFKSVFEFVWLFSIIFQAESAHQLHTTRPSMCFFPISNIWKYLLSELSSYLSYLNHMPVKTRSTIPLLLWKWLLIFTELCGGWGYSTVIWAWIILDILNFVGNLKQYLSLICRLQHALAPLKVAFDPHIWSSLNCVLRISGSSPRAAWIEFS